MIINESKLRRIIREETRRELGMIGSTTGSLVLTRSDIRVLEQLSLKSSQVNEAWQDVAIKIGVKVLTSIRGRRVVIALLKVVQTVVGYDKLIIRNVSMPMWDKAIRYLKEKRGITLPFTAQELYDFFKWFLPGHYLTMPINFIIELLEDMSDEEWVDTVNDKKEKMKEKVSKPKPLERPSSETEPS